MAIHIFKEVCQLANPDQISCKASSLPKAFRLIGLELWLPRHQRAPIDLKWQKL